MNTTVKFASKKHPAFETSPLGASLFKPQRFEIYIGQRRPILNVPEGVKIQLRLRVNYPPRVLVRSRFGISEHILVLNDAEDAWLIWPYAERWSEPIT